MPIHFGGMSDPFQPKEATCGVTKATLHVLAEYEYPTVISTRGELATQPPYLELLRRMKSIVVQFSMSTSRDSIARLVEPRSSPPSKLLNCMEVLSKHGIPVTCRWQPYIPGQSECAAEFASRISGTGCVHIGFEHLKVPLERNSGQWKELIRLTGTDPYREYKTANAVRDGREFVLPAARKLATIIQTATEVHRRGMTFGAADNEFQYLSDTNCCCSGVDQFPGFENYFTHQIGYAIRKCKGRRITYESIKNEWTPTGSVDRFLNSKSRISARNKGEATLPDHIRLRWNQPWASGSPSSFFGIRPLDRRSRGMTVYDWDIGALRQLSEARLWP